MPIFQSQSHLVLLPFRVLHKGNYVTGLTQSDVVLLEDGKPRPFTVFDTPTSLTRLPVELALLFDITPRIEPIRDPADFFRFISQWDDNQSAAALSPVPGGASHNGSGRRDHSVAIGHVAAARPARSPRRVCPGDSAGQSGSDAGPLHERIRDQLFYGGESRGWTMEAAIGLLNEVSEAQDRVARVLVMFSEGVGSTTTVPEDIGSQALDLGIPIYPVATDYKHSIHPHSFPRNYFRMQEFEALGKMTGGRAFEYAAVDARTLREILDGVVADAVAQYVVGFSPAPGDGPARRHQLQIRLASKSMGAIEGGRRRAFYQ